MQHSSSLILGFAVAVAIWLRELVSCRDFILRSVATFWVMSLIRIYPGRASWLLWNYWIFSVVKKRRILMSKLQWWGVVIFLCMQINDLMMSMQNIGNNVYYLKFWVFIHAYAINSEPIHWIQCIKWISWTVHICRKSRMWKALNEEILFRVEFIASLFPI